MQHPLTITGIPVPEEDLYPGEGLTVISGLIMLTKSTVSKTIHECYIPTLQGTDCVEKMLTIKRRCSPGMGPSEYLYTLSYDASQVRNHHRV